MFCYFRPNFFQMCTPDWENLDCGTKSDPKFITDYECRGNEELIIKLSKDMHRSTEQLTSTFKRHAHTSFFSGHASVAWSSASFVYLYLEGKFKNEKITIIPSLVIKLAQISRSTPFLALQRSRFTPLGPQIGMLRCDHSIGTTSMVQRLLSHR